MAEEITNSKECYYCKQPIIDGEGGIFCIKAGRAKQIPEDKSIGNGTGSCWVPAHEKCYEARGRITRIANG